MPRISSPSNRRSRHSTGWVITSLVVPGTGVTIARRLSVSRLKSVDLPTLGRPTMAMLRFMIRSWRAAPARAAAGGDVAIPMLPALPTCRSD